MDAITPSVLRTWDQCPKKLGFREVEKLPQKEHDYFEYGKKVERHVYALIMYVMRPKVGVRFHTWKNQSETPTEADAVDDGTPAYRLASEIFKNRGLQNLLLGSQSEIQLQPELQATNGLAGHPDIVVGSAWIDVKTSAGPWGKDQIEEHKWQGKSYQYMWNNLPGYFVVGNKATMQVQCLKFNALSFEDLKQKVEIVREAFKNGTFPASPDGMACRFCDYSDACDRASVIPEGMLSTPKKEECPENPLDMIP